MKAETMTLVSQAILGFGSAFTQPVNQILDILRTDSGGLGPALSKAPNRVHPFQPDLATECVTDEFRFGPAGSLNQRIAAACDEVYLAVSGLPLKVK